MEGGGGVEGGRCGGGGGLRGDAEGKGQLLITCS